MGLAIRALKKHPEAAGHPDQPQCKLLRAIVELVKVHARPLASVLNLLLLLHPGDLKKDARHRVVEATEALKKVGTALGLR